ncbi:MAG: ATP-binding protein [Prevotella sp.]|nr:ATP-binding protein [Prevotella sp.]
MVGHDVLKNPWMDFASYGMKDASRFKGREEEIKKFLRIIDAGNMSVIYANSGIGKTSFLNAGISPIYQKMGYFPIHIVFPDEVFALSDMEAWLLQRIGDAFSRQEGSSDGRYVWESVLESDIEECSGSLWWHLHTRVMKDTHTGETFRPFLVFDQFEEIFTKSRKYANAAVVDRFFRLVSQLASSSLPADIEAELDRQDDKGNYVEIDSEHHYKVVFSLRKEYLSDFDYWTNDVNSISELHQNRMFLLPLRREQAVKVITEQPIGDGSGKYYQTLTGVTDSILDLIDPRHKDEIEPFMLSALCSKLYNKAASEHKERLAPSDVDANISNIVLEIYEEKVQQVFQDDSHLRRFEETLVDADGHRNRPKIKELDDIHFKEVYQQRLEDAHLVRTDTYDDDTYVELIHDLLAQAISKKREEEEQDRRIAYLERSKRRQTVLYAGILGLLLAALVAGAIWLASTPQGDAASEMAIYQLCLKADVSDSGKNADDFSQDDFWDVSLLLWTKSGDTLRLVHPIDPTQLNFHKGGSGTDRLTLTFTQAEVDSLREVILEVRPKSTLCRKSTLPINIRKHCTDPLQVDTVKVAITKNIEETDLYEGFVYTYAENSKDPVPLNEALVVMAGKTTNTDTLGHYSLSLPRAGVLSNHIYVIKQGYCLADTVLRPNVKIRLRRDTTLSFAQRSDEIRALWDMAQAGKRSQKPQAAERLLMKKYQIDDKKKLRRGLRETDSLYFVYYDNGNVQNQADNKADNNVEARVGDVRNIVGKYRDAAGRMYVFEGSITMENTETAQWFLDATQYDTIFNTRKIKATLIHANDDRKTKIVTIDN